MTWKAPALCPLLRVNTHDTQKHSLVFIISPTRSYWVTWKADGTRYLMLLTNWGVYLIDRSCDVRRVQVRPDTLAKPHLLQPALMCCMLVQTNNVGFTQPFAHNADALPHFADRGPRGGLSRSTQEGEAARGGPPVPGKQPVCWHLRDLGKHLADNYCAAVLCVLLCFCRSLLVVLSMLNCQLSETGRPPSQLDAHGRRDGGR